MKNVSMLCATTNNKIHTHHVHLVATNFDAGAAVVRHLGGFDATTFEDDQCGTPHVATLTPLEGRTNMPRRVLLLVGPVEVDFVPADMHVAKNSLGSATRGALLGTKTKQQFTSGASTHRVAKQNKASCRLTDVRDNNLCLGQRQATSRSPCASNSSWSRLKHMRTSSGECVFAPATVAHIANALECFGLLLVREHICVETFARISCDFFAGVQLTRIMLLWLRLEAGLCNLAFDVQSRASVLFQIGTLLQSAFNALCIARPACFVHDNLAKALVHVAAGDAL